MPKTLEEKIEAMRAKRRQLTARRKMIQGDHWQGGTMWTGPMPDPSDDNYLHAYAELERGFVSTNVSGENADRHRDGVAGREAAVKVGVKRPLRKVKVKDEETGLEVEREEPLRDDEQARIAEVEAAFTSWQDRNDWWPEVQQAAKTLTWAEVELGRCASWLRLYLARRHIARVENGVAQMNVARSLEEAMLRLRLHAPDPEHVGVVRGEDGEPLASWFSARDDDEEDVVEVAELNANNDTTLRFVLAGNRARPGATYPLGGDLPVYELRRQTLISEQVLQQNKLLNKSLTELSLNEDSGAFLERLLINADIEGAVVQDGKGGKDFKPKPMKFGRARLNAIRGIPSKNKDTGEVTLTTPQYHRYDPVDVTTFLETIKVGDFYAYKETKQLHVLISGDATASGRSRVQATNDFVTSLWLTKAQIEGAVRWLFRTLLRWAAYLSDPKRPDRYDDLRIVATAHVTAVQPTAEDVSTAIQMYDAGVIDMEECRVRCGIDDPDAMEARVRTERRLQSARRRLEPGRDPDEPPAGERREGASA